MYGFISAVVRTSVTQPVCSVAPTQKWITGFDQTLVNICALGRSRTDNLLIRSQMLYPLSYERLTVVQSTCQRDNDYTEYLYFQGPQPLLR